MIRGRQGTQGMDIKTLLDTRNEGASSSLAVLENPLGQKWRSRGKVTFQVGRVAPHQAQAQTHGPSMALASSVTCRAVSSARLSIT